MVFFDSCAVNFFTYFLILLTALYFWAKHRYTYWSRKGIEYVEPSLIGGNIPNTLFQRENVIMELKGVSDRVKGRFGGFYMLTNPALMVNDPELIKQILLKDFEYFTDRGLYENEEVDPLTANLLISGGEKWRNMRHKVSPAFTSGKLKQMVPIFTTIAKRLQNHISEIAQSSMNKVEARDLISRYTVDAITSLAFGVEIDSINNSDEMFRKISQKIAEPNLNIFLRSIITSTLPLSITNFFKIKSTDIEIENFFRSVTHQSLDLRENQKVVRNDFFQILVQLRNEGLVKSDGILESNIIDENNKKLTVDQVMAQVFVFFFGGFDTSASVSSYALYELAKNPEIQRKAQIEIDETFKKHNNEWTYDCFQDMKYCSQVFDEALRKYPPVPILFRQSVRDYKIPETDFVLDKNMQVMINLYALHRNPKYFPDPLKFDPDRFALENKDKIVPYSYLPFGDGPRNCIGMRYGQLQSKIGLVSILSKFNLELAPEMGDTIQFKMMSMAAEGGVQLIVTPR